MQVTSYKWCDVIQVCKSMHEQINAYNDDVNMLIVSSQDQDLSQSPKQVKNA